MLIRSLALALLAPSSAAQVVDLVTRNAQGLPGNGGYHASVAVTDHGLVAFVSSASNLVPGDTNGKLDVFLRDEHGRLDLVSRGLGGVPADGDSDRVELSGDGRLVVFVSAATNLVAADTNGQRDLFAFDRELGTLERVNVSSQAIQSVSSYYIDGSHVTRDGRYVVFDSPAADLVAGDTNGASDVFLRDRQLGLTTRLSTAANGSQFPFDSSQGRLSPNGRYLVFSTASTPVNGDFNGDLDVYVRDLQTNVFERVSVSSQEVEGIDNSYDGYITPNGRFVVFRSLASNLVPGDVNFEPDTFVRDRLLGTTERVSVSSQGAQANHFSYNARITPDGRFVYYCSQASNLVPGDTNLLADLFVRDRRHGTTSRAGLPSADAWLEGLFALSSDGTDLAFVSRPAQPAESLPQIFLRIQPGSGPAPVR